ncbi:hypothetical protein [Gemmatimonas sp.]|uniref:hypothetical protein n=1 Tax=Gemmatimonas sp. TaxID=1962908 RepID=UPI0039838AB1
MILIELPPDWTPNEALAVVRFLDNVATAIWQAYGLEAVEPTEDEPDSGEPSPFDDTTHF